MQNVKDRYITRKTQLKQKWKNTEIVYDKDYEIEENRNSIYMWHDRKNTKRKKIYIWEWYLNSNTNIHI